MNKNLLLLLTIILFIFSCSTDKSIKLETSSLRIVIDDSGTVTELSDIPGRINYISFDTAAPLLQIRIRNALLQPLSANFDNQKKLITLNYINAISAQINYEVKKTTLILNLFQFHRMSLSN